MERFYRKPPLRLTQHIRYGLTPLPFGTLLPSIATSYILKTLDEMRPKNDNLKLL
jgi:hypothetical protein